MSDKELVTVDTSVDTATVLDTAIALLQVIPESDDDGQLRIMNQIMSAQSPEQMDAIWESGNLRDHMGYPIIINRATRAPSDYKEGLGFFLILDCVNPETGEPFTVTTGSQTTVVQVAWAIKQFGLPFECVPSISTRPSKDGYYPQRLSKIRKI